MSGGEVQRLTAMLHFAGQPSFALTRTPSFARSVAFKLIYLSRHPIGLRVTTANISDSAGAQFVIDALRKRWPWIKHLFADGAYDRRQMLDKAAGETSAGSRDTAVSSATVKLASMSQKP